MTEENKDKTQPLETEPLTSSMMRKTSSVPLRKETVRVTLKSVPTGALGNATEAQAAKPSVPAPAPPKPNVPAPAAMTQDTSPQSAKRPEANPNIPDVTSAVPLKQETMRVTLKADPTSQTSVKPAQPGKPVEQTPVAGKKPSAPVKPMTPESAAAPAAPKPPVSSVPDVTSAVPLKKETMAITLKADPTAKTNLKAPAPQAPKAGAPAAKPPVAGAPAAPKAPAAPVAGAAPKMASPAPTIALNTPKSSAPTKPLGTPAASQPLPQATVQLDKTQQLKKPNAPVAGASTVHVAGTTDEEEVAPSKAVLYLVAACFALSLFVLFAQFSQAMVWVNEDHGGQIGAIFSSDN
ncbi:hypothetical protein [Rubritalea marina]|uniref:hypothetical protein n=1 Tax=Rubritalea marina TaxID=361055 RepID=UPI00037503DF|nr:hypothetical protein [Rubritalea marina]